MMIGVMDSGIGGLQVLSRLINLKCADKYVYFADGANLPYGEKSAEELTRIAEEGVRRLLDRGANVIVFGCNTLSVCALDALRKRVRVPLFGLLPRPELTYGRALLLCTPTTGRYMPSVPGNATILTPPTLASVIDRYYPSEREIRRVLTPLLAPYEGADTVYLGCSHYLFATKVIEELLPSARVMEGATALAALIHSVLPHISVKNTSVDFVFSGRNERDRYARILTSLLS